MNHQARCAARGADPRQVLGKPRGLISLGDPKMDLHLRVPQRIRHMASELANCKKLQVGGEGGEGGFPSFASRTVHDFRYAGLGGPESVCGS